MIAASRPIRFLMITIVGWTGVRVLMLWPAVPELVEVLAPAAAAAAAPMMVRAETTALPGSRAVTPALAFEAARPVAVHPSYDRNPAQGHAIGSLPPVRSIAIPALGVRRPTEQVWLAGPAPPRSADAPASRLAGSAWMIVRPNGRATPFASQLGGSQAGVRMTYALDDARRLSLAARFSSALASRQREAAVGIDWKPTALPIHLIVEQRIAVEDARGGATLGVIGGIGPVPVGAGFRLEAYGQAGAIARDSVEGFADGAVRIAAPIASVGKVAIDAGAGAWGGAQRGAARLDIGPSIAAAMPVAGRTIRLSVDWRHRIAGDARPGSGPAVSLGTDF